VRSWPENHARRRSVAVAEYEYKTEILTSMVGREKLRVDDLDDALKKYGDEGWELVSLALDADLRGARNGHLLVFKRAKA
jgi:Domain of unknown function (DUF4177)